MGTLYVIEDWETLYVYESRREYGRFTYCNTKLDENIYTIINLDETPVIVHKHNAISTRHIHISTRHMYDYEYTSYELEYEYDYLDETYTYSYDLDDDHPRDIQQNWQEIAYMHFA